MPQLPFCAAQALHKSTQLSPSYLNRNAVIKQIVSLFHILFNTLKTAQYKA